MSVYLVDTNVISEFTRPQPDARVVQWLDAAVPESLYVSVITFGEIRLGIDDLPAGKRREALEEWFTHGLPAWCGPQLLPVTKRIADRWGAADDRGETEGYFARYRGWSNCRNGV